MTTKWIYRINMIVPEDEKGFLNALWTIIASEGDLEVATFGIPLSANGDDPATHRGISTAATEVMRLMIENVFVEELINAVISVELYTQNNWESFLASNELQVIEPENI